MQKQELHKGLNIISCEEGDNRIINLLQWANNLANANKVLFISWEHSSAMLQRYFKELGEYKNINIDTYTEFEYLDASSFVAIFDMIEDGNYSLVFLEGISHSHKNHFCDNHYPQGYAINNSLTFLANKLDIILILIN
jgi:predicted ATP-dependent serine protease